MGGRGEGAGEGFFCEDKNKIWKITCTAICNTL
jgi:hypothetical protein